MAGLLGDTGDTKLNNLKLRSIMTVKLNYFKFTLILHPITYLTLSPKAREFPLAANNHSDNKKAEGMWSRTWPDSECILPTAVYILNIQRSARELKPVYTSLQLLLVQVRSLLIRSTAVNQFYLWCLFVPFKHQQQMAQPDCLTATFVTEKPVKS